jgi:hypothetical protein
VQNPHDIYDLCKHPKKFSRRIFDKPENIPGIFIIIPLVLIVIFLDVYAWLFGNQDTIKTIFLALLSIMLLGWGVSGLKLRELPLTIGTGIGLSCILISFIGIRALLSPAYRASIVEMKRAEEIQSSERIADIERIAQIIDGITLPGDIPDDYRVGNILIAFHDQNGIELAKPEDWFDNPEESNATDHLKDAQTLVWIERIPEIVGAYHMKVLGPITANKTGNALIITWKIWLIDLQNNKVIAHEVFLGPDPPTQIDQSGDYGIPPLEDVVNWLANLPKQ